MSVKRLSFINFYMLQINFSVVFLFWNRLSDITSLCYAATRSWRFSPFNFIRSTNVCLTTKLSSEETPPIAKCAVMRSDFFSVKQV